MRATCRGGTSCGILLGRCLTNDIHDDSIRLGNRDEGVVLLQLIPFQVAIFNFQQLRIGLMWLRICKLRKYIYRKILKVFCSSFLSRNRSDQRWILFLCCLLLAWAVCWCLVVSFTTSFCLRKRKCHFLRSRDDAVNTHAQHFNFHISQF